jgi:hypothetical protein
MPLSASDLIQRFESGGQNIFTRIPVPGGQALGGSGIYQYIPSTWRSQAQAAGVDVNQYPLAINAPVSVQQQVFAQDFATHGFANWAGNPNIMAAVQAAGGPQAFTAFGGPDNSVPAGYAGNSITAASSASPADYGYFGLAPPFDAGGSAGAFTPGTAPAGSNTAQNYGYFGLDPNALVPGSATPQTASDYQYFGLDPNFLGAGAGAGAGTAGTDAAGSGVPGATTGTPAGSSSALSDFYNRVLGAIGDFLVRGGMVIAGVILLALAVWAMLHRAGVAPRPSFGAFRRAASGGEA